MLDIFVLGPVRASTAGREHALGGAKQCAILARLVLARGRSLPASRLISELWDEFLPRDPAHALQARISRLRSAVPVKIELVDGGYRIDPTQVQTDAERFEQLYAHGTASLADGGLPQAAEHIGSALDLWQGRALTGLADNSALRSESVRLEKLRSAALSDRIDLDLTLGRSAAVIPELYGLLEEHPFAERHWGQLMTALYCDGRVQEALDAFALARSTFATHLGIEPSSELGRLHMGILQEQPPRSLLRLPDTAPGPDTASGPGADAAGTGARNLSDLRLTSNHPDTLVALLDEGRTLLLTGPAGIGKTHLLRALRTRFEARRCSVSLLTASPLSHVVPLGIFTGTLPEKWTSPAALIDHFTRHRSTTMLLVDNVDQLDESSLFVVGQLVRNSRVPTILTARSLADAPEEIRALYDSGDVVEIVVNSLSGADADDLVTHTVGGALTPAARGRVYDAARGIPLHLREVLTASVAEGRLVLGDHGWELHGDPASTTRLTQLAGERFNGLSEAELEAATKVAIAGEYPASVLAPADLRAVARAGIVEYSGPGWLRLSHPLDREFLRGRCTHALWLVLSREVRDLLLEDATTDAPAVRRRAHILALDLGEPIEIDATLDVAEHALGAFDERLAFRGAEAVIAHAPGHAHAHRIAGLAASALGKSAEAVAQFDLARAHASAASELTAVALAHAHHLGLRQHDAVAARTILEDALQVVKDPDEVRRLRRDVVRWSVIAGQAGGAIDAPVAASDAGSALGLITAGVSGVITGPLADTERALIQLRHLPTALIDLVPGGASLIDLTEIMALSNTGDVKTAQRRLRRKISDAEVEVPESVGVWEYALGFSELLSGDAEQAYARAVSAVAHLQWRDTTGLLSAAQALTSAAADATGRDPTHRGIGAVAPAAENDPKVVMLRAWAEAWRENAAGSSESATRILLDTARWLLTAQHTYFAGMLAHCAVRIGTDLHEAVMILQEATLVAGGGLLELFTRHGVATMVGDGAELDATARDAHDLGMITTAADTWLSLSRGPRTRDRFGPSAQQWRLLAEELRGQSPAMASWVEPNPGEAGPGAQPANGVVSASV